MNEILSNVCNFMPIKYYQYYSETCILKLPFGPEKGGLNWSAGCLYFQVHFTLFFRAVCSKKKGGLKIHVVFLDSGHKIQVSL